MRAALLVLLAGAAMAQPRVPDRSCSRSSSRSTRGLPCGSLAYFEAFRGAEAACTCSAVTGAKGEPLTFSRASTATCTKTVGTAPQQIANGDLVTCTSGQPVVMPGEDGTAVSGLLVEATGTNTANRSEELDNAYWSSGGIGAAGPIVTADYLSQSPFATPVYSYAERFQFAATTAGQLSYVLATPFSAVASSASVYARGTGGSGVIDLCIQNGASTYVCVACNFTSTAWTRCKNENVTAFASGRIVMGTLTAYNGGTARSAADVLLVGTQAETGPVATSYIPTAGATATRAGVAASFPVPAVCATGSCSAAVTASVSATTAATWVPFSLYASGTNYMQSYEQSGVWNITAYFSSLLSTTGPAQGSLVGARIAQWEDGTSMSGSVGATSYGPIAGSRAVTATTLWVGSGVSGGNPINGIAKRVCLDPSPTRCR